MGGKAASGGGATAPGTPGQAQRQRAEVGTVVSGLVTSVHGTHMDVLVGWDGVCQEGGVGLGCFG